MNGGRPQERIDREEEILECFEEDPTTSTRKVGMELGINHATIHRVLKDNNLHPFKYRKVQELRNIIY